jgi:hypothetical protein
MAFFQLSVEEVGKNQYRARERNAAYPAVDVSLPDYPEFTSDLANLRGRGFEGPQRYRDQEVIATRVGEHMFRTFLPSPVAQGFHDYRRTHARPRVALHLPRSLFALPWEVLKDPSDRAGKFLSLIGSVIRCDESETDGGRLTALLRKERLKLLAVSANPKDRPVLGDFSWRSSKQLKFKKMSPATFDKFETTLSHALDCDGFVFWGHGDIDEQSRHGVLVFLQRSSLRNMWTYVSDPKHGYQIGLLFNDDSPLRLGYIFACESAAWLDQKLEFTDSIVGELLKRTPLAFLVGAQTNLDVYAAEICLNDSMAALSADPTIPLDLAITAGRRGILNIPAKDMQKYSALDWWVPVTYVKRSCLLELEEMGWPFDPFLVKVPRPDDTATASPLGGLSAAGNVGTIQALSMVATASIKTLFS